MYHSCHTSSLILLLLYFAASQSESPQMLSVFTLLTTIPLTDCNLSDISCISVLFCFFVPQSCQAVQAFSSLLFLLPLFRSLSLASPFSPLDRKLPWVLSLPWLSVPHPANVLQEIRPPGDSSSALCPFHTSLHVISLVIFIIINRTISSCERIGQKFYLSKSKQFLNK